MAQVWAVMRMELRRGVSWRSFWVMAMAFAPVVIIAAHAIGDHSHHFREETLILNGIVQIYYVRFGIFFGGLGLFLHLLRGEMAERTLHYLFLAPLRREALLVGKFLAGVLTAALVFGTGVVASFLLMYSHFGEGRAFLAHGPGLVHLRTDLLVVLLASLGYGAVFLAFSLLFKNPAVPGVLLVFWEGINGALPAWLKHLSVTFYLKPLFPVELPITGVLSLFTVVAEPTPVWLSVAGLIAFAGLAVTFACWRMRRIEISYSSD
jgi:ABC-type transport system involved in multi-copper enzyme maturation permease subunit